MSTSAPNSTLSYVCNYSYLQRGKAAVPPPCGLLADERQQFRSRVLYSRGGLGGRSPPSTASGRTRQDGSNSQYLSQVHPKSIKNPCQIHPKSIQNRWIIKLWAVFISKLASSLDFGCPRTLYGAVLARLDFPITLIHIYIYIYMYIQT